MRMQRPSSRTKLTQSTLWLPDLAAAKWGDYTAERQNSGNHIAAIMQLPLNSRIKFPVHFLPHEIEEEVGTLDVVVPFPVTTDHKFY
jgi:hypothetical protein